MGKIYIVILKFKDGFDCSMQFKVTDTKETAQEILKNWANEKVKYSWINEYHKEELEQFSFRENFFCAKHGRFETIIYFEEKELFKTKKQNDALEQEKYFSLNDFKVGDVAYDTAFAEIRDKKLFDEFGNLVKEID